LSIGFVGENHIHTSAFLLILTKKIFCLGRIISVAGQIFQFWIIGNDFLLAMDR
jgi:hypothetical protein